MAQTTDATPHYSLIKLWDYSAPACAHRRQLALDNLSFLCGDTSITIVTFKDARGSWSAIPIYSDEPYIFPELSSAFNDTCSENPDEAISVLLQATQRAIPASLQRCAAFRAVPVFRGSGDGMGYDTAPTCPTTVHGHQNGLFTPAPVAPASSNLEDISVDAPGHVSQPATHWGCFPTSTAHENIPQAYRTKRPEYQRSKEEGETAYNSSLATVQYTETVSSYGLVPYHRLIEFQELEQRELDAEVFAMIYHDPCRDWDLELYEDSETWMAQHLEEILMEEYEHGLDRDYEDLKWVELAIRLDISEREATSNVDQHRRRVRPSEKRTHCYLDRLPCEPENECLYHREARLRSEYLEAQEALTAAKLRKNRSEVEQLHENLLAYERSENPLCEPLSRDYFFNILNASKDGRRRKHIQEWMQAQETVTTEAAELHADDIRPDCLAQPTRQNDLLWAEASELNTPGFSTTHWMWGANGFAREWMEWSASLRKLEMRQTELEDAVRDGRKSEQSKSTVGSQTDDCDMEGVSAKGTVAGDVAITTEEPELMQSEDDTQMEDVNDDSGGTIARNEEQVIYRSPYMFYDYEHGCSYMVTPPAAGQLATPTVPFASVLQIDPPQSPCDSESTYCIVSPPHSP